MMKVVWPKPPSAPLGRQLAPAMLAIALLVFPAYAADVVWHDMSNQEQEEWVIRWDIPGSVRHSMERRSIQGAEQRQEPEGRNSEPGRGLLRTVVRCWRLESVVGGREPMSGVPGMRASEPINT